MQERTQSDNRVVVVSQHYPPDKSGNAARIHDTAKFLVEEGWDVTVLAPPPEFPHGRFDRSWTRSKRDTDGGVTVYRLWAWQPAQEDPGFVGRIAYYLSFPLHALLWLIRHYREYDVVVTSSPPIFTGLAGVPFALLGRKPVVVDVRDLWIDASVGLGFIESGSLVERASRLYEKLVLNAAEAVTVTTKELGTRLVSSYGIDESKIVHIPNGVDTERYTGNGRSTERTIVYTGNVGHAQDLESCIRAMDRFDDGTTLRIVGDGDIRSELEAVVGELGLEESVEFTGLVPREEVPEILDRSAIGVAPLKDEETLEYAVPTKAYEYMACELPVVATGRSELASLVDAADGGVVVENDPDAFADAFESLLSDPEYRDGLGKSGREHVVRHYDRGVVAKRLGDLLDRVRG